MKTKLFFTVCVVFSLFTNLNAETSLRQFAGRWKNGDSNTGGIVMLHIRVSGPSATVQAWGKCTPQDCDWGSVRATVYSSSVAAAATSAASGLMAVFSSGASRRTVIITMLDNHQLQAEVFTQFNRSDRRNPYRSVYRFVPESVSLLQPEISEMIIQSIQLAQPGGTATQQAVGEPKRKILPDGSLQIHYADGTAKEISRDGGTITITYPNGEHVTYSFQQVRPADLPVLPASEPLAQWLEQHSESLLNTIKFLLKNDESAITKYLTQYEGAGLSLYEKISMRVSAITFFTNPNP